MKKFTVPFIAFIKHLPETISDANDLKSKLQLGNMVESHANTVRQWEI